MYKKFISLTAVLSLVVLCVGGCSKKKDNTTSSEVTATPEATTEATPEPTQEATPEPTQEVTAEPTPTAVAYQDGCYAGFEDGVTGFLMLDTAPGDADHATMEVVDHEGSKALKVTTTEGKVPYVGIDASSLLGTNITKLSKMTMDLTAEYPDGKFYSVSGHIYAYSGADRVKSSDNWSVYMEDATSKQITATLDKGEEFVEGAQNLFVFAKETDNALAAGGTPVVIYLDNIAFYDAAGNALPIDTSVSFDRPAGFGEDDRTNLTNTAGDTVLENAAGSCAAWGQAVTLGTLKNDGGVFDPELLKPGCVVTVWYASTTVPEVILQSWSGGEGWAKVAPKFVNDSNTIAQFTYDDMIASYKSDDLSTLDNFMVGGTEADINVTKVAIGAGAGAEVVIDGAVGSCDAAWGQAITLGCLKNDGGTFDPAMLKKGTVIKVYYTGTVPELVFQSWSGGEGWAKVAPMSDDGSVATFAFDDIVASYKSDDFSTLDNFIVGATEASIDVTKVTLMSVE